MGRHMSRKEFKPRMNANERESKHSKLFAFICAHLRPILFFAVLVPALHAETFYLTVAGLGGAPEYDQRFSGWAKDIDKLLKSAEANAKIETLFGADATKANIESKLLAFASAAKPDDSIVLMMIGHGTWDNTDYKFNLPGPDI